jgi:hypothetical protein
MKIQTLVTLTMLFTFSAFAQNDEATCKRQFEAMYGIVKDVADGKMLAGNEQVAKAQQTVSDAINKANNGQYCEAVQIILN